MNKYVSNISSLKQIEDGNHFRFTFEGNLYYLLLNTTPGALNIQLKKENSLISLSGELTLNLVSEETLFSSCKTVQDLKDIVNYIIKNKQITLTINPSEIYKLVLFDIHSGKYKHAEITLKDETIINENILFRLDDHLQNLYALLKGSMEVKDTHCCPINEDRSGRKLQDKRGGVIIDEESVRMAINDYNKIEPSVDSVVYLLEKMNLFNKVMDGFDGDIGCWLKNTFKSLSETIYNKLTENEPKREISIKGMVEPNGITDKTAFNEKGLNYFNFDIKAIQSNLDMLVKDMSYNKEAIKDIKLKLEEDDNLLNSYYKKKQVKRRKNLEDLSNIKDYNNKVNVVISPKLSDLKPEDNVKLNEKLKSIKDNFVLRGHTNWVNCILILPSGYLVSASDDKTIKMWDIENNQCYKTLEGHSGGVTSLILLPDGKFASGSYDKTIKIWDYNTYHCIKTLKGHSNNISSLLLLKSGKLASASDDRKIKIWQHDSNTAYKHVHDIHAHNDVVSTLINLVGNYFASGSNDKTIKIWNDYLNCVNILQTNSHVYSLLLLPGGDIAAGIRDQTIKIWKCGDGYTKVQCIKTLSDHSHIIYSLGLFGNDYIISGSWDTSIKIWDIRDDFKCINTLRGHSNTVTAIVLSKDNKVISASMDFTIRLWE
jgi:WD40 repeat protein